MGTNGRGRESCLSQANRPLADLIEVFHLGEWHEAISGNALSLTSGPSWPIRVHALFHLSLLPLLRRVLLLGWRRVLLLSILILSAYHLAPLPRINARLRGFAGSSFVARIHWLELGITTRDLFRRQGSRRHLRGVRWPGRPSIVWEGRWQKTILHKVSSFASTADYRRALVPAILAPLV